MLGELGGKIPLWIESTGLNKFSLRIIEIFKSIR